MSAAIQKWQNVSAGPRQLKDLNRAISALRSEGQSHDELWGVIGGDEHRSTLQSLLGPDRAEVTALDAEIRERFACQVTRENVRDIIAAYAAAMPEARKSRPVEDNRRTPEEDAGLKAAAAEREAKYEAERDAQNALLEQVMAKAPHGARALIFAEYHKDTSDPMTDYFGSRTTRTVAIGYRFSSREDFRALRAAAATFPETAHMASEDTLKAWQAEHNGRAWGELEHRDNHSMGAGNYLSDHGWAGSGSGWLIKSRNFPCSYVHLTEDAIPSAPAGPPSPAAGAGGGAVTVSPSSLGRDGVVEIRFAERPGDDVLAGLRAHGFRWARGNRCWYGSDAAYAQALATA